MSGYLKNIAVRRVISLLVLISVWEIMSRMGLINPFYAPAPSEVLRVVVSLFIEGTIFRHLEATFTAALAGLIIGLALGAHLLHVPAPWIGVGVLCLIGFAIIHGVTTTRHKDPPA